MDRRQMSILSKQPIKISYDMPAGNRIDLSIDPAKFINRDVYKASRTLHDIYECDYLFIPKDCDDVLAYLNDEYDADKILKGAVAKNELEHSVFDYVESLLDQHSFECSYEQLVAYCQNVIDTENRDYANDAIDETLQKIIDSDNKPVHLKKMIIQLAIEFLSEGSGMSSYVGGSFGKIQSDIFEIIIDEQGEGKHTKKHSRLYEGTMTSLGLSDDCKYYRDYFDTSTYTVMNYVFLLCQNKKNFFRFVGSLFRNEACFVNFQKQLGGIMEDAFGADIDRRYFDVHAIVDQDHSNWALDNIIKTAVETHGDAVISEILRGFIGYKLYQDLNDIELSHAIDCYDNLAATQMSTFTEKGLLAEFSPQEKSYFIYEQPVVIKPLHCAKITITHDLSEVTVNKDGYYIVPAFFPVWIDAQQAPAQVFTISL